MSYYTRKLSFYLRELLGGYSIKQGRECLQNYMVRFVNPADPKSVPHNIDYKFNKFNYDKEKDILTTVGFEKGYFEVAWGETFISFQDKNNKIYFEHNMPNKRGEMTIDANKQIEFVVDITKPFGDIESYKFFQAQSDEGKEYLKHYVAGIIRFFSKFGSRWSEGKCAVPS